MHCQLIALAGDFGYLDQHSETSFQLWGSTFVTFLESSSKQA